MRISDWSSDVCSSDLFTLYHPGECLQADVRMRPHAHSGPWFEYGGTGMIEKAPGADGALLARWQDAIHCNAAADFGVARRDADNARLAVRRAAIRSEEHTSELQSLMRNSYAGFCLKKKTQN